MNLQLTNKVVLITGGAKGIGASITRGVAREGAVPVIVDRDAPAAEQLQTELQRSGATSHVITTELAVAGNCSQAVDETVRLTGRLDALVNNAGVNDRIGRSMEARNNMWRRCSAICCTATTWRTTLFRG